MAGHTAQQGETKRSLKHGNEPISVSFFEGDVLLVQLAYVLFLRGVLEGELVDDSGSVELLRSLFEPGCNSAGRDGTGQSD